MTLNGILFTLSMFGLIVAGSAIGVGVSIILAVKLGFLPGVKLPWEKQ